MAQKGPFAFSLLSKPLRDVIEELGFTDPSLPQRLGIPVIMAGHNVLLIAPTGSGKTEAALLPIFNTLASEKLGDGILVLYITPLRALNRDMLKRLNVWSRALNFRVEVRHGDTPASERRKQSLKPPHLLVTTPETLQAILCGKMMQRHLKRVRWVVVDEIHQLASNRKGAQLAIGLERLRRTVGKEFQRIGLSATVGSPDLIARFLIGMDRDVRVVKVGWPKGAKYFVEKPVPIDEDHQMAGILYTSPEAAARLNRISELIDSHSSTLVFVNSRTNAETLGSKLNMLRRDIGVHHGSLSREERVRVENQFKEGKLRALVCTSTLELGIDIGAVDFIIQYMSPRQVSTLIQRVGRSGHKLDASPEGTIISTSTDDTLESLAAIEKAGREELEPVKIHMNALDVLAHQIVGCTLDVGGRQSLKEAFKLVIESYPYSRLSQTSFNRVVSFMEKLGYLRQDGENVSVTGRGRIYYFQNLSMIPDERRYPVVDIATQQTVGIVGDEFVMLRARVGVHFIIKGRVWRIHQIAEDGRIYVMPIDDPTASVPGWDGEMLPVPYELAETAGALREKIAEDLKTRGREEASQLYKTTWPAESYARSKVLDEIVEHLGMQAPLPTHRRIVLESFGRYLIVHATFGDAVNNTLGWIFEEVLGREGLLRFWWADGYRILVELTVDERGIDEREIASKLFRISVEELEELLTEVLHKHSPFGYRMKFVAERFGALERGLTLGEGVLRGLPLKFRETPIYDETVREVLLERLDFDKVREVYGRIRRGEIMVETFRARTRPTPIAYHILNRYIEISELTAPESIVKDSIERMKMAVGNELIGLLCFECGALKQNILVNELEERPKCKNCSSGLLAPLFWSSGFIEESLKKKLKRQEMFEDEIEVLTRYRRAADLVLSYGKKAVIALSVYGVGPQTASKILAKMHDDEREFYKDLLDAKLHFITTRPFWDRS